MATGLRERKKEKTRVSLMRAAVELFHEKGYQSTTVDDIVDRVECSRSTFFRYFSGKEDVVFGDVPERLASLRERLASVDPKEDAWTIVRDEVTSMTLEFTLWAPEIEAACVELWFSEPALRRRYTDHILLNEQAWVEFFERMWGDSSDTGIEYRALAAAVVGVGRNVLQSRLTGRPAITDALNRGFDLLEQGVLNHCAQLGRDGRPLTSPGGNARQAGEKRSRTRR